MKKWIFLAVLSLFLVSFVFAAQNQTNNSQNISQQIQSNIQERQQIRNQTMQMSNDSGLGQQIRENIQERNQIRKEIRNQISENGQFVYTNRNGTEIIFTKVDGQLRLRTGEHQIKTALNLSENPDKNNNSIIEVQRGDITRQIKIMPDTAAERALERLRLKVCNETNNCTIELKEVPVGNGDNGKVEYNVQIERHSKILGIFEKKMQVSAEVDAETGNVISEHKPWWAFIATEPVE